MKNKKIIMERSSKESLIKKNKKDFPSLFYSITEKQEESRSSSIHNSILEKPLISENSSKLHFIKSNKAEKDTNINEMNLKPINEYKITKKETPKTFKNLLKDIKININEEKYKKYLRYGSQKKVGQKNIIITQQNPTENNNIRKSNLKRNLSTKNKSSLQLVNNNSNIIFKGNNNSLFATWNQKINLNSSGPIPTKSFVKIKTLQSVNLSNSNSSNIKFFSKNQIKSETFISKKIVKINENNDDYIFQNNLFEKLKNSPMFEKSEKNIYKEKIFYGLIAFCTLMSIIFQVNDALLYNRKSKEYLEKMNQKILLKMKDLSDYKIMEEREISKIENYMRILNIIFNFFCIILSINIFIIKSKYFIQTNTNHKNRYNYYYNKSYISHKKKNYTKNSKNIKEENHIIIVPKDNDLLPRKALSKSEIKKVIISIFINLFVFPPNVNKVFIIIRENVITIYSLNSIFLIISIFKLINLYISIIHFSPINNLMYRTICKSRMIKTDSLFGSKFFLNKYPKLFMLIFFILNTLMFCILIFCIEFFSLDIKEGMWNNKGDNNLKNIYNILYIYLFYIVKIAFGNIKPLTILGSLMTIVLGTSGLMVILYFTYYCVELIKFTPEEEKAYIKLKKIFNPLNNEHKAANLIRFFFLMWKLTKEFKDIEKNYIFNKRKRFKTILKKYSKNFNIIYYENEIYNSLSLISDRNVNQDKRDFQFYLCQKFLLRVKLLSESKIFRNELILARNFSNSFLDLLKTLGHKMKENLNLINAKLQLIMEKENKYNNFKKFEKKSMKKIKKIIKYEQDCINYLINKQNENYNNYLNKKRKFKKSISFTGSIFNSKKKLLKSKFKNQIKKTEIIKNLIRINSNSLNSKINDNES